MNVYQIIGGFVILISGLLIGRITKRNSNSPQEGKGFLSEIFKTNRELDSTVAMGFTFIGFFILVGAISAMALRAIAIPDGLWNLVNMFENFILMILSSFFTKATMNNNGEK